MMGAEDFFDTFRRKHHALPRQHGRNIIEAEALFAQFFHTGDDTPLNRAICRGAGLRPPVTVDRRNWHNPTPARNLVLSPSSTANGVPGIKEASLPCGEALLSFDLAWWLESGGGAIR
jgi:hypothetical protein